LTGRIDPYELDPAWAYASACAFNYALFIQRARTKQHTVNNGLPHHHNDCC
jgi:hypothetical protein